jgi:acyl dehydratase
MTSPLYVDIENGAEVPSLTLGVKSTQIIAGALASRDYSPLHHDKTYVMEEAGHPEIFLNTPHQAALFERLLYDWLGPRARIGRMRFQMKASVYAGATVELSGAVIDKRSDTSGCCWLDLDLSLCVDGKAATQCRASIAIPVSEEDDLWRRADQEWQP